jgi:hypothetical protein
VADAVEIELTVGEDFAAQIFWTDEYGDPVPVAEPALLDVKDANGQIAMRFATTSDAATQPKLVISGFIGFFQLTAPSVVTRTLTPGKYLFDLFAAVADSAPPFSSQQRQVISGWFVALPRVTQIEAATEVGGG